MSSGNSVAAKTTTPLSPFGLSDEAIAGLIERHRPGWSLAQPFYNDPRIFERDVERIIFRQWQIVDHESRIPQAGDYFLFEVAGESIIVVRGKDEEIRAFFNVCRHRGSRICLEPSGSAQALVCPYHAWSFALDGRLLTARAMPKDFDPTEFGLRRCAVRCVEGLIFVCLAEEAPDCEPAFQLWEKYLRHQGLKQAKIAHRIAWRLKANWKLVIENFCECYHCGPSHPEYCSVMPHALPLTTGSARHRDEYLAQTASWTERAKALGSLTERITGQCPDKRPGSAEGMALAYKCYRMPVREGFLTQSQNGQPVAPLMGAFKAHDGGAMVGSIEPLSWVIASCDHALFPRFVPAEATETEVEMVWLVRSDAIEGVDYRIDELTWLWRVTTEQDNRIVEDNQAGVNSRAYVPGPYSDVEPELKQFTADYLRRIA